MWQEKPGCDSRSRPAVWRGGGQPCGCAIQRVLSGRRDRCPWAVLTPPSQPFPCRWHLCLAGSGGSSRGCCPGTPESSCPTPAGSLGNDVPRLEKPSQGKCQRCPTLLWWLGVFLTACQGPRLCLP